MKESRWGYWFGLCIRGRLAGQPFATSRNWLTLGGAVFLGLVRHQMLNHQKTQKIKRCVDDSLLIIYHDLRKYRADYFMNLVSCLSWDLLSVCAKYDKNLSHLLFTTDYEHQKKNGWPKICLHSFIHFPEIWFVNKCQIHIWWMNKWINEDSEKRLKFSVFSNSNTTSSTRQ